MSSGETYFTTLGKLILWGCVAVGIIAALIIKSVLEYDGIRWSAVFGGAGGGVGGLVGQILAKLTGQVQQESRGRGPGNRRR